MPPRVFRAHGLDVEVETQVVVSDLLDEADGLPGGIEEIGLGGGEGFHRDGDPIGTAILGGGAEDVGSALE